MKILSQPSFEASTYFRDEKSNVTRVSRESRNNTLTFDHECKLTNYATITKVVLNRGRSLRTKGTAKKPSFDPNSEKCDM